MAPKRVAILGGGVAGLTVAHELARWNDSQDDPERCYEVTVFEARGDGPDDLGGKARSWETEPPAPPLEGEHGFRFFGGFYKNVIRTMEEIPVDALSPDGPTVADQLVALTASEFYAEPAELVEGFVPAVRAMKVSRAMTRIAPGVGAVWLLGGPVVIALAELPGWTYLAWLAGMVLWKLARWCVEARAADGAAEMEIRLRPDGSGDERHAVACFLDHVPLLRWWWIPLVALAFWWGPPWPVWVVIAVAALGWFMYRQVLAMSWLWRNLRGRIPHDVKPRGAESIYAFLAVIALVTSCPKRFYEQWENRSWWEYIGAWRFSDRYQLTLATGLTRGFVATKAERMSARTGGAILAQLIYDIDPYLTRQNAPDRVLNGPTSDVWIRPWIEHLRGRGIRFNEYVARSLPDGDEVGPDENGLDQATIEYPEVGRRFHLDDGVTVQQLLLDRHDRGSVDGFRCVLGAEDSGIEGPIRHEFDHYVLAVSGTAAQRILGNSPLLLELDRGIPAHRRPVTPMSTPDPVPYLDGIFELEFGWMTGIVFHFDEPIAGLPFGHLLCLDSEWALTAIDQRPVWKATGDEPGGTILSVNISDWFRPSTKGLPAQFATVGEITTEVWGQLCRHLPALHDVECPDLKQVVLDKAVTDPGVPVLVEAAAAAVGPTLEFGDRSCALVVENLPLTNAEKLLINTAGSWRSRPCATTAIPNLFVAGDYVRTQVDFASMESANEAGRWAANAVIERDAQDAGVPVEVDAPRGLEVPPEMSTIVAVFQAVDRVLYWIGLPHPASIFSVPVGWFTRAESRLRDSIDERLRPARLLRRERR